MYIIIIITTTIIECRWAVDTTNLRKFFEVRAVFRH